MVFIFMNCSFTNQYGTASGKYGNIGATMVCSTGKCQNVHVNNLNVTYVLSLSHRLIFLDSFSAPSACGDTIYTNHHVNIQGNAAYRFISDAVTYGAGGIKEDNGTTEGVTCSNGVVIPN